jgi:hypothetical protein
MNKQSEAVGAAPVLSGWAQSPCAALAIDDTDSEHAAAITAATTNVLMRG